MKHIILGHALFCGALVIFLQCNNPNVAPVISNSAACAVDIIEDVTVAIDVAATVRDCGIAVADIYALVTSLLTNMPDAGVPAGVKVSRSDYVTHLQQWQAATRGK